MHPSVNAYKTDVDEHEYMIRHVKSQDAERLRAEFLKLSSPFRADIPELTSRKNLVTRIIIDAKERKSG